MGFMKFREANQVKWVGTRPGHNGEAAYATIGNSNGLNILYTVPVGKTLFLTWSMLGCLTIANGYMYMEWTDAGGARQLFIHVIAGNIAGGVDDTSDSFSPPFEIPAGHLIRVFNSDASMTIYASVYGWLE